MADRKRTVRRGDTVACGVAERHAAHIWVMHGFPYPLRCNGEAEGA